MKKWGTEPVLLEKLVNKKGKPTYFFYKMVSFRRSHIIEESKLSVYINIHISSEVYIYIYTQYMTHKKGPSDPSTTTVVTFDSGIFSESSFVSQTPQEITIGVLMIS